MKEDVLKPDGFGLSVPRTLSGLRKHFLFPPFTILRTTDSKR